MALSAPEPRRGGKRLIPRQNAKLHPGHRLPIIGLHPILDFACQSGLAARISPPA